MKNTAVFGIYPDQVNVESAIDDLRTGGFRSTDISVLYPENVGNKDLACEKHTKAPEGASTGAASGAVVGGAVGWLIGAGVLALPEVGAIAGAGPLVAALAGAGALGTVGGIAGALAGLGVPEFEAKRYEGRVRKGGVLLSVHCDNHDWVRRAKEILIRTGAEQVSETREAAADFGATLRPVPRTRGGSPTT